MKKELPTNEKKILKFLLEQQLPDARVAGILGRDGKSVAHPAGGTWDDSIAVTAVDHVTQVALETCRCVHLQEHLPNLLDLELCRAVHHPRGWLVANPVHSMHLQTQLEDSVPAMAHNKQPPVLYGEEQQRTMALNTEGIVEYWCPLDGYSAVIHDDTAMEKMEHMPTLQNIHKPSPPPSNSSIGRHSSSLPVPPNPSHAIAAPSSYSSTNAVAAAHPSKIPGAPITTSTARPPRTAPNTSTEVAPPSVSSASTLSDTHPARPAVAKKPKLESTRSSDRPSAATVVGPQEGQKGIKDSTIKPFESEDKDMEAVPPEKIEENKEKIYEAEEASSKRIDNEFVTPANMANISSTAAVTKMDKGLEFSNDKAKTSTPTKAGSETAGVSKIDKEDTSEVEPRIYPAGNKATGPGKKSEAPKEALLFSVEVDSLNFKSPEDKFSSKEKKLDAQIARTTKQSSQAKAGESSTSEKASNEDDKKGSSESSSVNLSNFDNSEDKIEEANNRQVDGEQDKKSEDAEEISQLKKDELLVASPSEKGEFPKKVEENKEIVAETENIESETKSTQMHTREQGLASESPNDCSMKVSENVPREEEDRTNDMDIDKEADKSSKPDNRLQTAVSVISSAESVPSALIPVAIPNPVPSSTPATAPSHPNTSVSIVVPSTTPAQPSAFSSLEEEVPLSLPEEKFNHLRIEEDRIRLIRRSLSSHRILPKKKVDSKKRVDTKKKRKRDDFYKAPGIPGWHASNPKELTQEQEDQWLEAMASSRAKVERWIENYRTGRETFWDEHEYLQSFASPAKGMAFYLPSDDVPNQRCCETCTSRPQGDNCWDGSLQKGANPRRRHCGDELMQCLECNFVACSPKSLARDSKQHILEHLLLSGHKFAVSCGERGQLFCFCCGDFVYHEVFEQEKARIDYSKKVALMAWKPHKLYRSFNPFHFMKTQDHGIVWRGLIATYPQLVPHEHIRASEATCRRQALFNGEVQEKWFSKRPVALTFAASQSLLDPAARHRIRTPVGMYNLGNTCYKSAVLQCLVHCQPLQRFFLKENGHHHHACRLYRQRDASKRKKKKTTGRLEESICLACEMDKLLLSYYGSTIGVDVRGAVEEACSYENSDVETDEALEQGDPLVISEMLTASWNSGGMNSLASYKQHDSHEFMNSFLEMVGKQTKLHWARVHSSINAVKNDNAIIEDSTEHERDIVKTLFEGSLSSVLLCEECGTKRKRTEEFLNVSLSLSEEVARMQSTGGLSKSDLSVETCLERFVMPEKLGDSVSCPSCAKKTSTQKQHTFGTLPKVLCLHLKRFDAALNKKIDDFVSFPARGLNMGKYLAQWCEVTGLRAAGGGAIAEPQIYYDLFGTVNHVGNMQSGHYVTNVKVDDRWYHFNDAHVSLAGSDGGTESVVKNAGAYILFYVRREEQSLTSTLIGN